MGQSLLARAVKGAGGAAALVEQLGPEAVDLLRQTWDAVARPEQRTHETKRTTLWLAGRGFGKSFAITGAVHRWVESGRYGRIAVVAPTASDVRDTVVQGESGILKWAPPHRPKPVYQPSKRRITFWNGAMAFLYSAEEPDRLRGPQFHAAACDELAAWRYLDDAWDMLRFCVRLGDAPRFAIATTPRPLTRIRELAKDPEVHVVRGSTYDNSANLSEDFIEEMRRKYENTRLGRQEIHAEILDDNPRALWRRSWIDASRMSRERFERDIRPKLLSVVVSVDPAVSTNEESDETGIVTVGAGPCVCGREPGRLHGFVLADSSGSYRPVEWAEATGIAYETWRANRVLAETNQGGDLVEANLRTCARTRELPFRGVHAKDGKRLRAEPVASLYEQGVVHHVGGFPALEDQMVEWDPLSQDSPDRVDALTQALTDLLVQPAPATYRRHDKPVLRLRR